jgi:hypothetical protein
MAKVYKDDLTVIYLTANQLPEDWTYYQQSILLEATRNFPMITVSRKPSNMPNVIRDNGERSHLNMYKQMLRAAKIAKTPYIAPAEDDVLYHSTHFTDFRPPLDAFAYDMHRWRLFTWQDDPWYNWTNRVSNCAGILPRELFIEAWEERLAKFPGDSMPIHRVSEVGRNNQEEWMGVTKRKRADYFGEFAVVHVNHLSGTDSTGTEKRMGPIRAIDIPYWGKAKDIVRKFNETV